MGAKELGKSYDSAQYFAIEKKSSGGRQEYKIHRCMSGREEDWTSPPLPSRMLLLDKKLSFLVTVISFCKAQFIRRASAVPNLINIGFGRSTAQARLQFRSRPRVEFHSVFAQ